MAYTDSLFRVVSKQNFRNILKILFKKKIQKLKYMHAATITYIVYVS